MKIQNYKIELKNNAITLLEVFHGEREKGKDWLILICISKCPTASVNAWILN